MMEIKNGVDMKGLQLPMRKVLKYAESLWKENGQELVVTSALDGTHSAGSYHYYGYGLDFRTRYFTTETSKRIAGELSAKLGNLYTVIFEGNHIHTQYNIDSMEG